MNDLLSEFVELAPKGWGVWDFNYPDKGALINSAQRKLPSGAHLIPAVVLHDDRASAEALIFLLDWLERQGWFYQINNTEFRSVTSYFVSVNRNEKTGEVVEIGYGDTAECIKVYDHRGKTRIEAVVRAVVEVLKSQQAERSTKPDLSAEPTTEPNSI